MPLETRQKSESHLFELWKKKAKDVYAGLVEKHDELDAQETVGKAKVAEICKKTLVANRMLSEIHRAVPYATDFPHDELKWLEKKRIQIMGTAAAHGVSTEDWWNGETERPRNMTVMRERNLLRKRYVQRREVDNWREVYLEDMYSNAPSSIVDYTYSRDSYMQAIKRHAKVLNIIARSSGVNSWTSGVVTPDGY